MDKVSSSGKVTEATSKLLNLWESGDLPEVAARTIIQRQAGSRPADSWSLGNNILMFLHGTDDARGFRQWEQVERKVNKGSKAFYILGPITRKTTEKDAATGEARERVFVSGFKGIPVFRLEDTSGEPVTYPDYTPPALPPLSEVAREWGIDVTYRPFEGDSYGHYVTGGNRIVLRTHEELTFFHELVHAAHDRIESLKGGQDPRQEIVAEATAATLCLLYGFEAPSMQAKARGYVSYYAQVEPEQATRAVIKHLATIQKVLDLILTTASELAERELVPA